VIAKLKDPSIWGRHLAVAAAYAACYEVTKYFSFSHWVLPAGLRVACLLLVPRKFWPALAVGEMLPLAEFALMHSAMFGAAWAALMAIPPIALAMPIVAALKRRMELLRPDGQINMSLILVASLLCAGISTAINCTALSVLTMPDGSPSPPITLQTVLVWVLGYFLGSLSIAPSILAVHQRMSRIAGEITFNHVIRSPLLREVLRIELPVLITLLIGASFVGGDALPYFRIGMAIPVIVLAWRFEWHGAAIGGLLASSFQAATATTLRDPAMIQAQVVLAMVLSGALMLGARSARRHASECKASKPQQTGQAS
jgi:glucose-6-phosphate-specific signal transduction histidine kinase